MASLAGQQAPQQPQQQNMNPVVEVFCEHGVLQALNWGDGAALAQFVNNTPPTWGSTRAGDGNPICIYRGNFLDGLNAIAMPTGSLTAICQYGLSQGYIEQVINSGGDYQVEATEDNRAARETSAQFNMVLVQRDQREGGGAIRGLGLVRVSYQSDDRAIYDTGIKLTTANTGNWQWCPTMVNQYSSGPSDTVLQPTVGIEMELLVLGNATRLGTTTRLDYSGGVRFASGGRTIRAVQLIGAFLPRGIGLHGLETVITLYHNYGWRFRNSCQDEGESQRDYGAVQQLVNFFDQADADGRRQRPEIRASWIQENIDGLMSILYELRGFGYHQHRIHDREGKSREDYAAWVMANANSGGYRMLLCQPLNIMWYIVTGQQQLPQGEARPTGIRTTKNGGRKRRRKRKRTKKRALKKRHRRTKRKRKRKTRRKKKGGKHKLSNKKCKMLRHQHSKLTHHVNMVGKALQVQCKKRL